MERPNISMASCPSEATSICSFATPAFFIIATNTFWFMTTSSANRILYGRGLKVGVETDISAGAGTGAGAGTVMSCQSGHELPSIFSLGELKSGLDGRSDGRCRGGRFVEVEGPVASEEGGGGGGGERAGAGADRRTETRERRRTRRMGLERNGRAPMRDEGEVGRRAGREVLGDGGPEVEVEVEDRDKGKRAPAPAPAPR
mmetsp:Transcript_18687/g.30702  ORF Transcript_18687/g.30702 Transcript_18687/m.30702 type:complete len:201 (-) Transcript_18687:1213-1815(-)